MSFRLFSLSSMYSGYIDSFYNEHPDLYNLSYNEHINILLAETTEFVGAYIRNFRKSGIDADCVIANDHRLQRKWANENSAVPDKINDILFGCIFIQVLHGIDADHLVEYRKGQ